MDITELITKFNDKLEELGKENGYELYSEYKEIRRLEGITRNLFIKEEGVERGIEL